MRKLTIDPTLTKTYKTVANLEKALTKLDEKVGLPGGLTYLLTEVDGRFTAVFTNTTTVEGGNGMYLSYLAGERFKVVG